MKKNDRSPRHEAANAPSQSCRGYSLNRGPTLMVCALALAVFLLPAPTFYKDSPKTKATSVVDINQANVAQLQTLPGIGRVTARKIVEFREKNGPFKRVEELLIIRGMSVKKLEKIRSRVTVGKAGKK